MTIERLRDSLADRYRIERELGQGGMATVYLAQDLRHDRRVALKVLRPELAAVIGAERFLAEIKTTANLQHPHILPLHDSGGVNGTVFYVMPFVEGESLRDRLTREKQLPVAEAVRIAREAGSALDYAHRHGVIHRDIKPENILLHDGQALIADFGIALAASRGDGSTRLTETGMSLGTPMYMSPEQAMGERDIDARTDIYSLGCVLYEMLAGEAPFTGPTAQAIIAKVMATEPEPVTTLRRTVAPGLAAAVHTAIQRLRADRFPSAREFIEALDRPATTAATPAAFRPAGRLPVLSPPTAWALILGLGVIALGAGALALRGRPTPGPGHTSRFAIALPPGQGLLTPGGIRVAFAPDGQSFVYPGPGNGRPGLWRRRLDQLRATLIAGSEGATTPAFSPDGQNIAFVTLAPFALKVIPAAGGTARTVVSDSISGGGVAWSSDGYLYFDGVTGLARVRPDGSDRSMVMPLDTLHGEAGVGWPEALPGGHGVLVRVRRTGEPLSAYRVVALDLRTGRRRDLVQAALARYSPTGHILFLTADGRLHAQRFDLERLELRGEPEVLWDGVALGTFGAGDVAVSTTGDLIYATGAIHNGTPGLVWVSRDGGTTPADSTSEDGIIRNLALSPDGSTAALQIMRPTDASDLNRIYVKRLPDGPTQLVTSEPVPARDPVWGSNGQEIFYTTGSPGTTLMKRRADGSGAAVQILSDPRLRGDLAVSVDGRTVLMKGEWRPSNFVLARYRVGEDTAPVPMPSISSFAPTPKLSPDGRWLAYVSGESGRPEVYVRPFPDVEARKVQVSVEGGVAPNWRPTGGELYYISGNGELTAATVRTTPTFEVTGRTVLFPTSEFQDRAGAAIYSPAPDGKRFLMLDISGSRGTGPGYLGGQLVIVHNFAAELRRDAAR